MKGQEYQNATEGGIWTYFYQVQTVEKTREDNYAYSLCNYLIHKLKVDLDYFQSWFFH